MHSRFYLSLLLISSLVLMMFIGMGVYREMTSEWKTYQTEYKNMLVRNAEDDAARKRAEKLEIGLRQNYVASLNKSDRCMSCHIGVENPYMAKADQPFTLHSGDYIENHPVDKFGCTICHYGQGRATNKKEAHGKGHTHWDYPIIPTKYIQSACAKCHDYKMLQEEGAELVVKGEKLFREKGCRGCHKLNGVGGDLGKALDGIGSKPRAYYAMKHVVGEHTAYNWIKQHFDDPRAIVPTSEMRVFMEEDESDLLTTYIFSIREEEMPSKYRFLKNIVTPPRDGESLYKMFCVACHGSGKISVYDEIFDRTIPAITNPPFLRSADNKTIKNIVMEGRGGTQMTSWKTTASGLKEEDVDKIVEYVASSRTYERPEPFNYLEFQTNIDSGMRLYNNRCSYCHGKEGKGGNRQLGINLKNSTVQQVLDPEFLALTIRDGREGTPMPSFGGDGLGLSDQNIADVVAYVKTFGKKK